MTSILNIVYAIMSSLPPPMSALCYLVFFIGVLTVLLKLIKLILDAIPFV